MNTKNMKRWVLGVSIVALAIVFISENPLTFGFCKYIDAVTYAKPYCVDSNLFPEYVRQIGAFLSLSLIFLSLITYKMKDEVFQAWWRFARWWVPVIIAVTLFLQNAGGGGGLGIGGAVSGAFDALVLGILYAIFIITSLVKIMNAYLKTKGE